MIADRLQKLANFYLVYCRDPVRIKYGQHDYTIIDLSPARRPVGQWPGKAGLGSGHQELSAGGRGLAAAGTRQPPLRHWSQAGVGSSCDTRYTTVQDGCEVELETKVHPKVRNYGEGPY